MHITNQTRVQLKKRYAIVPSDAGLRDAELLIRDIQCYLISPEVSTVVIVLLFTFEINDSMFGSDKTYNYHKTLLLNVCNIFFALL